MATHVRFDEGMNDLPIDKIPPNVQLLQRSEFGHRLPIETEDDSVGKVHLFSSPFAHTPPKTLKAGCDVENYGFDIDTDPQQPCLCAFILFNY